MIKGIQTSAAAMRIGIVRQDITANNLANADTAGFKRDRLFVHELVSAQMNNSSDSPTISGRSKADLSSGALNPTGDPLHVGMRGEGFFVVSDGAKEFFTRSGAFQRAADGVLIDKQGRRVQGEGGDITLPVGTVTVGTDGVITVDGTIIDKLRIVQFDDPSMIRKDSGSSFTLVPGAAGPVPALNPAVAQGFLETSNVDSVREMVEMIATARNYEVNAKLLTAQDDSLRHVAGELGRV